ncbi:unnamed protein product [Linum tenue]|uniref:Serine aminopeptidase S33 domain-containing protein n=1 Tax=Linum tenue TaxID=586396 RepID=A0AAV0R6U4_9ROSI|nr:unnamed protein product [Linum tenue]
MASLARNAEASLSKLLSRPWNRASSRHQPPATVSATLTRKKPVEDATLDLNSIASQNLDHAHARRLVRSAFTHLQQQLDHPLYKLAPPGIRTEEWYEINFKGQEVFCKSWMPKPGVRIKGSVCFCHGYGDTCTFFFEGIASQIASSGYAVYAVDHPGFGLSEGLHGYIQNFDDLVDNAYEMFAKIKGRPEVRGLPSFILGQSMGGAVTIKLHLKDPSEWDGVILVAPMCRISDELKPPAPVLKVLTCMASLLPKAKLMPENDLAELAFRDPVKRKMCDYNVISYSHRMRLKTAVELLKATEEIEAQVDQVSAPLLILHGAADKVTDPTVSQFLYENAASEDKTLKLYEGGFHSILEGEPDDRIFAVFVDIMT